MAEEGEENISHCKYSKEENTSCKLFSKETRITYSSGPFDGIHKDRAL